MYDKRASGCITIPDCKLDYGAIIIKLHGSGINTDRVINGTEEPGINPHAYRYLILDNKAKSIQCKKESILMNNVRLTGSWHAEE